MMRQIEFPGLLKVVGRFGLGDRVGSVVAGFLGVLTVGIAVWAASVASFWLSFLSVGGWIPDYISGSGVYRKLQREIPSAR